MLNYLEIVNDTSWTRRQKAKRLFALFNRIAGSDCPLDVLALIMGRNFEYCRQQEKTICDVAFSLDEKHRIVIKSAGFDHEELIDLLVECKIITVTLRLIAVQNKFWEIYEHTNDIFDDYKMKLSFLQLRFGCVVIICHVLAESSASLKDQFCNPSIINVLMQSIEGETSMIILCALLTLLKSLLFRYKNKKSFEKQLQKIDGVKICQLMNKNIVTVRMMTWINKGILNYEKLLLISLPEDLGKDILKLPSPYSNINDYDINILKPHAVKWALFSYFQCGFIILQLLSPATVGNKICGRMLADDKDAIEGLINWAKVPTYHSDDLERVSLCVKILGYIIVDNEKLAKDLIHKYNIVKYLEFGVCHPNHTVAEHYIICVGSTGRCNASTRRAFVDSDLILQALIRTCFAAARELQETAIYTLHSLVDKHTTPKIIKAGFSRKELLRLHYFYDLVNNFHILYKLRKDMEKYHCGLWKKEDEKIFQEFESLTNNDLFVYDLKEQGKRYYIQGNYKKAVEIYSRAIKECPPTSSPHIMQAENSSLIIEIKKSDQRTGDWHSLPAKLHSNRAQCYLQLNNFKEAISDCNYAIVYCDPENADAKLLILKTALRRSTGYFELQRYTEALIDIGYCIIEDPKNATFRNHFDKVFSKYYHVIGPDKLIRRCIFCLEGEGDKLKRCANCTERYCSRKCQEEAWERGHKHTCPKNNTTNSDRIK